MEEEGAAAALLFRQSLQHPESTTKTPINADKLLAHALNGLSIQDRERVYDEIHGINCGPNKKHSNTKHGSRLSISSNASNTDNSKSSSGNISVASFQSIKEQRKQEEDEALCKLQEEVDIILAASSASSASSSSSSSPAAATVTVAVAVAPAQSLYPAYRYALAQGSPLLSDRQFQLSFLRTEGYNQPRKAAVRFLKHLETLPDVFDTTAVLFRPLQLTDLDSDTTIDLHPHSGTDTSTTTANNQHGTNKTPVNTDTNKCTSAGMTKQPSMLEQGFFQVLPVRDSSGRRILCRFRSPIGTDNIKAWVRSI